MYEEDFDTTEGYHAMIRSNPTMGFLLGYLAIPQGHPWFEKDYDDIVALVHGGLTYSNYASKDKRFSKLFNDEKWIIGFDCGHAGDGIFGMEDGTVKTPEYVRKELRDLSRQAFEATSAKEESC